jgi:hypothetical protein
VKKTKHHESKVVKKELPKSTSSHKKERGAKGKKHYKEDDKLVEVYQDDFNDNLTDDAGHKSLEQNKSALKLTPLEQNESLSSYKANLK